MVEQMIRRRPNCKHCCDAMLFDMGYRANEKSLHEIMFGGLSQWRDSSLPA
jgi:hypothetical protein